MDDKHKDSYIKIQDLHDWLVKHRYQIDYVNLQWIERPIIIDCETNYVVDDGGEHDGKTIYAIFGSDRIDNEYSYVGDIEGATKYFENYDCWNGKDFTIKCGFILEGVFYSSAGEESWHYEQEDLGNPDLINIQFRCMAIMKDGKIKPYKGLIRRVWE